MHNARAACLNILVATSLMIFTSSAAESKSSETTEKTDEATKTDAANKTDTAKKNKSAAKKQKVTKKDLLTRQAKIKFSKAESIAQKQVSGKTQEIELELEDGKLVYTVEIESDDGTKEVSIDALTGKVLKVEEDHDDKSEKKEEDKVTKDGGDDAKSSDEASD